MTRPENGAIGLARLWRTIAPLPPRQHIHRATNALRKRAWAPWLPRLVAKWRRRAAGVVTNAAAMERLCVALLVAPPLESAAASSGRLVAAGRHVADLPPASWQLEGARPLEIYEVHYLGWAEALVATGDDADLARCWRSLESWHRQAPMLTQAWEPYPRARRALSCLRAAARLRRSGNARAPLLLRWLEEIALTAALPLEALLEHHLGGNHLLANRLALAAIAAAVTPTAASAEPGAGSWPPALISEWRRQFLPDGSHVEGSPMYHALLLEDAHTVAHLTGPTPGPTHGLTADLRAATRWCKAMQHPDGTLPAFGDCDPGVLADLPLLRHALASAAPGEPAPRHSAWVARVNGSNVIVHTGPMAFARQPGHAHADGLSLEYSYQGQRVLCDAGLSGYALDPFRPWNRSEAAHSVVEVPGDGQLELWGSFRVGARGETTVVATGLHDGWQWLAARLSWPNGRHHQLRLVALGPQGSLYVVDRVDHRAPPVLPALQRLRLHEANRPVSDGGEWLLAGTGALRVQSSGAYAAEPSRRFPRRGHVVATTTLVGPMPTGAPRHTLLSGTLNLADVSARLAPVWKSVAARTHIR